MVMVISHILIDTGVLIIGRGRGARRARFIDRGRLLKQFLPSDGDSRWPWPRQQRFRPALGYLLDYPGLNEETLLSTAIADVLPEASEILKLGTSGLFTLQFPNHSLTAKIRQVATRRA